jgi:hypothetical protein
VSREEDIKLAQDLTANQDWEGGYKVADRYLKDNPNDAAFLTILCYIMLNTHKPTMGYTLAKRVTQLLPKDPGSWLNLGMAANDLWQAKEAERAYKKALMYAPDDKRKSMIYVNLSSLFVDTGRFKQAQQYAEKAIEYNPDSIKGRANLGFSQLAQRQWTPGWENYRYCIGSEWRPVVKYNEEDLWDGKAKGTIAISGEQGLGDEVSGASMVPDMMKWAKKNKSKLILECDRRLENLFTRSFPGLEVHGTRGSKKVTWNPTDIDYSIPIMQLGEFFRLDDKDFTQKPYLKPDPDRVLQWKALFKSKKKPVIGIAWRSGIAKTGARYRQLDLEQLLPILKSVDAHWVSLQYKPSQGEIDAFKEKHDIDLVEYPHGTLTQDYDDTVAMVAAMDQLVIMHTSVGHVAGGLGVPCWTLVPMNSQWRYGAEGEDYIWADSVRIIRQQERGKWDKLIKKTASELQNKFKGAARIDNRKSRDKQAKPKNRLSNGNHAPQRQQLPETHIGREPDKVAPHDEAAAYNGASGV